MSEAEVQRLMGLLVRVIDAATQFGHPRNNDETDLDLAKRDFESALRELLPAAAPAAPEVPADARDAARLDWLERHLFEGKWTGTLGQAKSWAMAGPYRHTLQQMRGETLRAAIDAAMAAPTPQEPT